MVAVKDIQNDLQVNTSINHDIHLEEQLRASLRKVGVFLGANLQIDIQGSTVTLKGRVPSFYIKQLAQAIAMRNANVNYLQNEIHVVKRCINQGRSNL